MANYGYELSPPSNNLSQTLYDDDESSDTSQHFTISLRKTRSTKGVITTSITPSSSSNPHHSQKTITPVPKKPRGRPRGSKNKPKPPISIIKEVEDKAYKPIVIEIDIGSDLVRELTKFAQSHEMGLVVLNGSGCVTNVSLHQPILNNSLTLSGTYTLLSISGTYINIMNSSTTTFPPSTRTCSQNCSSFTVCVAGTEGQVFGGVITGKIVAASVVVVVAMLWKKPMFERLPNNNDVKTLIKVGDDDHNDDAVMRTMAIAKTSTFGVLNPSPINFHLPSDQTNVNEAPWGYPNLHPSNHN